MTDIKLTEAYQLKCADELIRKLRYNIGENQSYISELENENKNLKLKIKELNQELNSDVTLNNLKQEIKHLNKLVSSSVEDRIGEKNKKLKELEKELKN